MIILVNKKHLSFSPNTTKLIFVFSVVFLFLAVRPIIKNKKHNNKSINLVFRNKYKNKSENKHNL